MSFNQGWLCKQCGPVKESKKRSINKVQHECCKVCGIPVTKWERPLNERIGRCRNCGHGGFRQAMYNGDLIVQCKKCDQVTNPDTGQLLRQGKEEFKYERAK